jgi:nitrite reductase/ring-hydroxylating ferredoxin subunit
VPVGAWLSASALDLLVPQADAAARRLVAAGLVASAPAIVAGAVDWSEQHEQQMRVGVVHALANSLAAGLYGASLLARTPRAGRGLRLAGLAAAGLGGVLGGHISFRLAGGANHAEHVPHVIEPGWHHLAALADLPEGKPVRKMVGEVPVVAVRTGDQVQVLADRCSHMSGPLSDGQLADGRLTCPWHGSVFRLADGCVARGPATAPQPAFQARVVGETVQVCLPGAG